MHPEVMQGLSTACRICGATPKAQQQDKKVMHGVKAVIRVGDQCLVLRKDLSTGSRWDFPGGRIEDKEVPEDAVRREIQEEVPSIGNFIVGRVLDTYRFQAKDHVFDTPYEVTFFEVLAEPFDIKLSEEHTDFRWVTKDTVGELQDTPEILIEPGFFRALQKCLADNQVQRI